MTKLDFKGPFHLNELAKLSKSSKKFPGIYIWGFIYHYDRSTLIKPIDFKKNPNLKFDKTQMKFIPYYVGKSEGNMFTERLMLHHKVEISSGSVHADKYTRLNEDYMKSFFKDIDFPINTSSKTQENGIYKLIWQNNPDIDSIKNSKITYFNSPSILKHIYPGLTPQCVKDNYPITEQKLEGKKIDDTLYNIVVGKDNFWYCYAHADVPKKELSDCEATTFYSLKGKTISKIKKCPKPSISIEIIDNTDTSIFKISKSDLTIRPSEDFTIGY
jgi:hypothetical protein